MSVFDIFLGVVFLIVCVLLVVIVLLQKGRGGGLGAMLGGAGSSAFGTKTGDVFTWITICLVGGFLLLAIGTSMAFRPASAQVLPVHVVYGGQILVEADESGVIDAEVEIEDEAKVRLDCQTRGVTIHYTVDGADPTDSPLSLESGKTIIINPPMTLKALAVRSRWDPSEVTVIRFVKPKAKTPVTEAPDEIDIPDIPDIPEIPEIPEIPDIPDALPLTLPDPTTQPAS